MSITITWFNFAAFVYGVIGAKVASFSWRFWRSKGDVEFFPVRYFLAALGVGLLWPLALLYGLSSKFTQKGSTR